MDPIATSTRGHSGTLTKWPVLQDTDEETSLSSMRAALLRRGHTQVHKFDYPSREDSLQVTSVCPREVQRTSLYRCGLLMP
jgi:hypothetical protein